VAGVVLLDARPQHGPIRVPCSPGKGFTVPVHTVHDDGDRNFDEVLSDAVAKIQLKERIIASFTRAGSVLIITEKKAGRPAKESR
jgi:hypothetical protein